MITDATFLSTMSQKQACCHALVTVPSATDAFRLLCIALRKEDAVMYPREKRDPISSKRTVPSPIASVPGSIMTSKFRIHVVLVSTLPRAAKANSFEHPSHAEACTSSVTIRLIVSPEVGAADGDCVGRMIGDAVGGDEGLSDGDAVGFRDGGDEG